MCLSTHKTYIKFIKNIQDLLGKKNVSFPGLCKQKQTHLPPIFLIFCNNPSFPMVPYSPRRPSVTLPPPFVNPFFSLAKLTVLMGTKHMENCKERSPETLEERIKLTKHIDSQGSLWQLSIVIVFSLARALLSHCPILISRGFSSLENSSLWSPIHFFKKKICSL